MRIIYYIFIACILLQNCRENYDDNYTESGISLSTQVVNFSTVFENIPSSTYEVVIRNTSNKAVTIPSIQLKNASNTFYTLEVNGNINSTKQYKDVYIPKNDSIKLYTTLSTEVAPLANYSDEIQIIYSSGKIDAITLNASVVETETIDASNSTITSNTTWNSTKAKIITENVVIKNGASLTISPNTSLYFYPNTQLIVEDGGELIASGTHETPILFTGFRTETAYQKPGTWIGLEVQTGGKASINNCLINNMNNGINAAPSATITLTNTQIYNADNCGIYAENAQITASNVLINQARQFSVFLFNGGAYNFTHCTLVNYFQGDEVFKSGVYLSNTNGQQSIYNNLQANFINSILYSLEGDGLNTALYKDKSTITINFSNDLIRNNDSSASDFTANYFTNCIFNQDPLLTQPLGFLSQDLHLQASSPAINAGILSGASAVPFDFDAKPRTISPDLGALEY